MNLNEAPIKRIVDLILNEKLEVTEIPIKRRADVYRALETGIIEPESPPPVAEPVDEPAPLESPETSKDRHAELAELTVAELREIARALPIVGEWQMRKRELIDAIVIAEGGL